ncbi:Hypothetical predicted protein [Olea europaea subsp. europaea]|uniref:Uncharacterized protein n=1 Tax=Olea europaea subsp. europaea TaxID=158383 RepID=A0A8S0P836_OLEEU|nr:Hypothetical predicted protein [Olea europaea subsp. europaea]
MGSSREEGVGEMHHSFCLGYLRLFSLSSYGHLLASSYERRSAGSQLSKDEARGYTRSRLRSTSLPHVPSRRLGTSSGVIALLKWYIQGEMAHFIPPCSLPKSLRGGWATRRDGWTSSP